MSLLVAIVIGVLIGAAFAWFTDKSVDLLFINSLFGVAGSIIGLAVYFVGFQDANSSSLLSLPGLLMEIIGALIFVQTFSLLHKVKPKKVAHEDTEENSPKELEKD